jgi:hypothetical protein
MMSSKTTTTGSAELIGLDDRDGWESALREVPHVFAHTWDHCHAIAASSGDATYLCSVPCGEARIVSPLAERAIGPYVDVVTPYGLSGFVGSGDCSSLASRWSELAEQRGYVCGYLILNPVLPNNTYFGEAAKHHKMLFVFDLRLDDDELFARLSTNRRRQIRRAERDRDALIDDRERLTEFFVRTYPDFMARRDAAGVYELNEQTLRELCGSHGTLLVGAQRAGRVRAASLFGFTPQGSDFLYNVSLPGEESYSVRLIWAAVRELRRRGVPTLNLGGGVVENDSLAEFKRRFGADQVPLRNVKQIYRRDVYDELCAEAGVDPERSSYFPAYRDPGSG